MKQYYLKTMETNNNLIIILINLFIVHFNRNLKSNE
jgi:hypothetical protein